MLKQKMDLIECRNIHFGKKGLLIGSGPSLDTADLSAYSDHIIYAIGQSPVAIDHCDYYCFCDGSTIEASFWERARSISGKCIAMGRDFLGFVSDDITVLPRGRHVGTKFDVADEELIWGYDVSQATTHLMYIMGIRDITMIGIDYRYDRGRKYCTSKIGPDPTWGRNSLAGIRGSRLDGEDDPCFSVALGLWREILSANKDLIIHTDPSSRLQP